MAASQNMTAGDIPSQMIRFSIPILLGSSVDILYAMGDSMILGRLAGMGAFAAVGASGFFLWLILCVVHGNTAGFSSVFGRKFGAGDGDGLNRSIAMALLLATFIGLLLAAADALVTPTALRLMNTPPELSADAALYIRIRLAALPVAFVGQTISSVFYALGNSKTPFAANLISMAINLALDFSLVLWTPLGVAAVAIGTALAQVFTCVYCAAAARKLGEVAIARHHWRLDWRTIRELLRIGVPLGFRDFPSAIVALMIQTRINGFGTAYVAGVAAAKGLYSIAFALGEAFTGSVGTFVAQNLGAKQFRRIAAGMRFSHIAMLLCVAATIAVMLPFMRPFLSLYIDGGEADAPVAIAAGMRQLRLILYFLPTYYISILYRAALRGLGDGLMPLLSGFAEAGARVACLALAPAIIGGAWSAYLAEVIGWPCMLALLVFAYAAAYRRARRRAEA